MAMIHRFPHPEMATEDGLLAVGGDLKPDTLIEAYSRGIFPWPINEEYPLVWFCPEKRAILEWDQLHIPRSLERSKKKLTLRFTQDQAFNEVIGQCRTLRVKKGTWITPEMLSAYQELHSLGLAHSFEGWIDNRLVAGLYGVSIGGTFAAESMFTHERDASKLVLLHAMEHLHSQGLDWIDIQMMTPHLERLGARELTRKDYLNLLKRTQKKKQKLF